MVSIERLPADFFSVNRARLFDLLADGSLVVLCAGRPANRTADQNYEHLANRSFYYLSGVEQEEAIMLLYKKSGENTEMLFIPAADPIFERWNGKRLSRQLAEEYSGIGNIQYIDAFDGIISDLVETESINKLWIDRSAANQQAVDLHQKLQEILCRLTAIRELTDLSSQLIQLRMIKAPAELEMIKKASKLTGEGIAAIAKALKPGTSEYKLWSEFQYTLSQEGCLQPAFPTIVAAGKNALCLHYMQPYDLIAGGDLVQLDLGAEVGGLCADISRVLPANGSFTKQQLAVYEVVRDCQETAFTVIKPGIRLADINQACRETAERGLQKLGLKIISISDYFWHGVSHHLGMDVHDISHREAVLQAGMVLTVEPGIYIEQWGIGMRLEDDVVITDTGCEILSDSIPREAHEIEAMMVTNEEFQ